MYLPKWAAKELSKKERKTASRYFKKYGISDRKSELAPAKEFTPPLGYIMNPGDNDGYLAQFLFRGHKETNIVNAVEDVIKIMEKQQFSMGEALMFLRFVEQISLSSQLKV
jgi:hypothetical protein